MKKTFKLTGCALFIAINLLLLQPNLFAQNRAPQNIRRVTVTSQYVVENGVRKSESWAVNQEIYDSLGRLHTEIDYDFKDHYPHNYRWHTFDGKLRVKTETFENEKLKQINLYAYNNDSLIVKNTIKKVIPGDTSVFLVLNYTYNALKKPVKIEAKTEKGKMAYKSESKYDIKGTEISRKVRVKKGFSPQDSIINLTAIPAYDSLGRLVSNKIRYTNLKKEAVSKHFVYSYDKTGNLSGIKELNEKGEQIYREERLYKEKGNRLWQISCYDSADKLIKFTAKRYELYRTRDRKRAELE